MMSTQKEVTLTIFDNKGDNIGKYTLPLRIAKNKAKFFDNNFGQSSYEYRSELDKDTLLTVFDTLFYTSKLFQIETLDMYVKIYQILDYLMVPDKEVLLNINRKLFEKVENIEEIIHFAKTCPLVFKNCMYLIPGTINYLDVMICLTDLVDWSVYVYDRYLANINSPIYNKYLSEQDINNIESHFIENDHCNLILGVINENNKTQFIKILKKCKCHKGGMVHTFDYCKFKMQQYFVNYDFDDVIVILETYLYHMTHEKRVQMIGLLYVHFKDKKKEYLDLCDKFLIS